MRLVRTLVLPEPAPATMSTGPSVQHTALFCSSFRDFSIEFRLSVMAARNYEKIVYLRTAIC